MNYVIICDVIEYELYASISQVVIRQLYFTSCHGIEDVK